MRDRFATNAITMLLTGCALLTMGLASSRWVVFESSGATASARGYFSCSDCKAKSLRDMPREPSVREEGTKKSTVAAVLGWGAGLLGLIALVFGFIIGTQMIGGDAWTRSVPIIAASTAGGLLCFGVFTMTAPRASALGVGAFGYLAGSLCILSACTWLWPGATEPSPQPTSVGEKRGSKRHGEWRTFRGDGSLARLEIYDYGEVKSWVEYDEKGGEIRSSAAASEDTAGEPAASERGD